MRRSVHALIKMHYLVLWQLSAQLMLIRLLLGALRNQVAAMVLQFTLALAVVLICCCLFLPYR